MKLTKSAGKTPYAYLKKFYDKKLRYPLPIPEHFLFGHFDEVAAVTLQCDKRHFGAVVYAGQYAVVTQTAANQQAGTASVKSLTELWK